MATTAGIVVAVFAVWMQLQVGGADLTNWVNDVGQGVAAFAAAGACAVAARGLQGRRRVAWLLIGASALSWALGETVWCWYVFADGNPNPFPSFADVGFVGAVPTVIAGVVLLGFEPGQRWTGVRDALDGLAIAGSLMFISWMTALGTAYHAAGQSALARTLGLIYPISDVVVATLVLAGLSRARGRRRRQLAFLGAGIVALAVSDSAFAYLSAVDPNTSLILDTGWVAGFLLIALAAVMPESTTRHDRAAAPVTTTTQVVLPYVVFGIAVVAGVIRSVTGGKLDPVLLTLGAATTLVVMARQLLTMLENGRLARRLESTVTELRTRETELAHQAFHDALTGLANRTLFAEHLDHALVRRARLGRETVVMVCDLDDFKVVNDTLGHEPGDLLLQEVAERLRSSARAEDTVARLGGDEFAVLLEDLQDPDVAYQVARRMARAVAQPISVGTQTMTATVSIGIAFARQGGESGQALLRGADIAMYEAKGAGGNCFRVFEDQMLDDIVARLDLTRDLRTVAGRLDQLELHYQPIIDVRSAEITGVEALLRWRHPTRGLLPPSAFIELAETTGLIVPLGRAALRAACRQAAAWAAAGLSCPSVAVNLSPRQLEDPNIVWIVQSALDEQGLEAGGLTLEITESMTLNGAESSIERLRRLKAIGVRLAIDDFGSGYSSLEYLRQFPVDVLKIDRGFTAHVGENPGAAVLLDAMVRLAHTLGLETVVEGIETAEQLETVRKIGADHGQGYFIAEPAAAADVTASFELRRRRTRPVLEL